MITEQLPFNIANNFHMYTRNVLLNLSREYKNVQSVQWKKVAIIGAGPSLDETKERLQQCKKDGYTLLCTDRAFECVHELLTDNDFVVTIDPSQITESFVKCDLQKFKSVNLIASLKANPGLIELSTLDRIYSYVPSWGDKQIANKLRSITGFPLLPEFGHVSGLAYLIALINGAENIEFFGCDYTFYGEEVDDKYNNDKIFVFKKYYASPIKTTELTVHKSTALQYMANDYDGEKTWVSEYPYKYGDVPEVYTNSLFQHHKKNLDKVKIFAEKYLKMEIQNE